MSIVDEHSFLCFHNRFHVLSPHLVKISNYLQNVNILQMWWKKNKSWLDEIAHSFIENRSLGDVALKLIIEFYECAFIQFSVIFFKIFWVIMFLSWLFVLLFIAYYDTYWYMNITLNWVYIQVCNYRNSKQVCDDVR